MSEKTAKVKIFSRGEITSEEECGVNPQTLVDIGAGPGDLIDLRTRSRGWRLRAKKFDIGPGVILVNENVLVRLDVPDGARVTLSKAVLRPKEEALEAGTEIFGTEE
ncbi:MAG: hypothetical protein ACE5OY_00250 [Candidatus Bathyarchaeia archaeon]